MRTELIRHCRLLWNWLTRPAANVMGAERRAQATVISASLLALSGATLVVLLVSLPADTAFLQETHYVPEMLLAVLVVAYGLSRTAWARVGAAVVVGVPVGLVLWAVGFHPWTAADSVVLNHLVIAVLLSSLVFSLRVTTWLALATALYVATIPSWVRGATWADVLPSLNLIVAVSVLVLASMVIRRYDLQKRERQSGHVVLLNRIGRVASASFKTDQVLEFTCRELRSALGSVQVSTGLLDESRTWLRPGVEHQDLPGPRPLDQALRVADHPALEQVMSDHMPLAAGDAQTDPRLASLRASYRDRGVGSVLLVPLVVSGQAVGMIEVSAAGRHVLEEDLITATVGAVDVAARAWERARLFEAEQESRQIAETLSEIAQELNLAPDLESALDLVLARMGQVIAYDRGSVQLFEGNTMRVVAVRGFDSPELVLGGALDLEVALLNREVIESGRPLIAKSVATDPRWALLIGKSGLPLEFRGAEAWLGVPLLLQGRVIGMLSAEKQEPDYYRQSDADLALAFAGHAAVAIESARLLEAARSQLRLAQTLQAVGALLTTRLSLDEVLEQIFDLLARVVQYDGVSVVLLDDQGHMELAAGRGFPSLGSDQHPIRMFSEQSVDQGWGTRPVMVISDTVQDERWVQPPGSEAIRSWVGAALVVKDQVFGVLHVACATANAYDQETAETVAAFANQAAVAIENTRLYDRLRRELAERLEVERAHRQLLQDLEQRHMQLHTAAEISKSASTILAPDELMGRAVNLICERFGYYYVGLFLVNESGDEAVLRAGSGEVGPELVRSGHRLGIEDHSMVGWSIARARPRITHDAGGDPVRYHNPMLPATRSEVALPLVSRGRCVGALSVQSDRVLAFSEEDVVVLQTMADQLAVAIENAWLYDAAQQEIERRTRAEEEIRQLYANLEKRVEERTAELAAVNREIEAFGYSVSHDLRAPLRRVIGFSQALKQDHAQQLDEQGLDFLDRLESAGRHMNHLIDSLLGLSQITRQEMHRQRVDLSGMALAIGTDLKQAQPERSVEIVVAKDLQANGDPRLLRILLQNLMDNAFKFTANRAHARIEVGAAPARSGRQKAFYVRDNGAGFDTAYMSWLFTAFRRLHSAEEFEGSGIGLATVQRIVHRHGGQVWAEGNPGQGATFFFSL
jgi:GAF domain-containing protein